MRAWAGSLGPGGGTSDTCERDEGTGEMAALSLWGVNYIGATHRVVAASGCPYPAEVFR